MSTRKKPAGKLPQKKTEKNPLKKSAGKTGSAFLQPSVISRTHPIGKASDITSKSTITKKAIAHSRVSRPRFTGQHIVKLSSSSSVRSFMKRASGMSMHMATTSDFNSRDGAPDVESTLAQADGLVFEKLKLAIINQDTRPAMTAMAARHSAVKPILKMEPERYVYASPSGASLLPFTDNGNVTWGLQATNVFRSIPHNITGKGVRIAILDTGISTTHPDFLRRVKASKCFVQNSTIEDGNGHGTHCAGVATGNLRTGTTLRYGVAPEADLYIGKVLNNKGEGKDRNIFQALEWALENKCHIVSMSFGSEIDPGETYYTSYEDVAKEALKNNCLLIAAAGNDSERPRIIKLVNHPANCPSIMAIAAVDADLKVCEFSCGGSRLGAIDIAAPGGDIFSGWKGSGYRTESGTSMATPFVAGIAALLKEKYPHYTMKGVRSTLLRSAKKLSIKKLDVGSGLVHFK
jgi:subtilisin family serine protease